MTAARRIGVIDVVLIAVVGATLAAPTTASAVDAARVVEVGWWTDLAVPEPPDGGIKVGHGGDGPTSVAALRITATGGTPARANLTLTEAGGIGAEGAAMQLCPTRDDWEATNGGAMADAPNPECDERSVELDRDASGSWSADMTALLDRTTTAVMIVPVQPDMPLTRAFDVAFEPPDLDAPGDNTNSDTTTTTGSTAPREPRGTPTTEDPPLTTPAAGSTAASPRSQSEAHDPPPTTPVDSGAPAGTSAAPSTRDHEGGDEVAAPTPRRPLSSTTGGGRPWGRVLSFAGLAAAVGTVAALGRWQFRRHDLVAG